MSSVDDHWWSGHTISTWLSLVRFNFCHWCHLFKFFIFLLFTFLSFILSSFLLFSRSDFWLPAGDTNDTFVGGASVNLSLTPLTCMTTTSHTPPFHLQQIQHNSLLIFFITERKTRRREKKREEESSREEEKEGERRRKQRRRRGEGKEGGEGQHFSLSLLKQPWKLLRVTTVTVSPVNQCPVTLVIIKEGNLFKH